MKFYLKYILVVLVAVLFAGCEGGLFGDNKKEQAEVKKCFEEYRQAIVDMDGERAYSMLSSNSKAGYDKVVMMCREYDSLRLARENVGYRYLVLMTRHLSDPDTLMAVSGKELYISSVVYNVVNTSGLVQLKIKEVKITGNIAKLSIIAPNGDVGEDLLRLKKENGKWKFDIMKTLEVVSDALKQLAKQDGVTENEAIYELLESKTGEIITSEDWIPARETAVGSYN